VKVEGSFCRANSTAGEGNDKWQIVDQNPNLTLAIRTTFPSREDVDVFAVSRFVKPLQRRAISTNLENLADIDARFNR